MKDNSVSILKGTPYVKEALLDVLSFYKAKAINNMASSKDELTIGQAQGMYHLVLMLEDRLK